MPPSSRPRSWWPCGEPRRARDAEDELKRAWRRFVALLAADRPLAIGVDDAHWADEGTLNLLEEAAFGLSKAPVIILCTCRPSWPSGGPTSGAPPATTPSSSCCRSTANRRRGSRSCSCPRTVARSPGGSPTPRAATRSSPRRSRGRSGRSASEAMPERLPDTVQAAIAARIDLLPRRGEAGAPVRRGARPHLRAGPARRTCSARIPATCSGRCGARRWSRSAPPPTPGSYAFRHQLIRDVAYGSLPRAERAGLHDQAAERADGARARSRSAPSWSPTTSTTPSSCSRRDERRNAACDGARRGRRERRAPRRRRPADRSSTSRPPSFPRAREQRRLRSCAAAEVALRRWRGDHALGSSARPARVGRARSAIPAPPAATPGRSRSAPG